MKPERKTYKIGELGRIVTGKTPALCNPIYFGETYPFITPSDMKGQKYAVTERSLSDEGAKHLKSCLIPANSVSVSCIGWQMGKSIMTDKPSVTNQQLNSIIPNDKVVPDFLYYSLSMRRDELLSLGAGTGVRTPILNKTTFSELSVELPPLETQRKIAAILSAYDELIENNTRRIKILEEMARMIYREWFVNFRFPGHEKVKMVDSPLGKIPEGWEVRTLGEVCSFIKRGISPKYDESSNSIVINQKCIRDFRLGLKDSRKHKSKVPAEKFVTQGDVLINSTGVGTLGRVAQVLHDINDCTVDSHVTIVRPCDAVDADFMGLQLFELQGHFESLGQGATGQTELGREAIANTDVIVAIMDIQEKFSATVKPMRWLARRLAEKNENLRQTRDLLLPKLISGEVAV